MRSDRLSEISVVGEVRRIHRRHVQLDVPLSLFFGDPKSSVDIDQMGEPELLGEEIGTTEGFGSVSSQVIDMLGLAISKGGWSSGSSRTLL